jgi:CBS domain-containing protein
VIVGHDEAARKGRVTFTVYGSGVMKVAEILKVKGDILYTVAPDSSLHDAIDLMAKYKNKLKKYRTCGLEKGGEYSYENLVFKVLRRNGYLSKLVDFKNDYVDKSLSLEQEKFE